MKKFNLDKSEQDLLDDFESGDLVSILSDSRKDELKESVTQTLKKDKRINIRLSSHDLSAIQRRAHRRADRQRGSGKHTGLRGGGMLFAHGEAYQHARASRRTRRIPRRRNL